MIIIFAAGIVLTSIVGLLVAEHRAGLSEFGHEFAEILIVLAGYALLHLWLRAAALAELRRPQTRMTHRVLAGSGAALAETDKE